MWRRGVRLGASGQLMHTSPSRQSSGDDAGEEGSDGEGVAEDVSVPDVSVPEVLVLVLVLSVAGGVGVAVVFVAVSVAWDTMDAACASAGAAAFVSGIVTLYCWFAAGAVGVAWGATACCSCGVFLVRERVADEVCFARCVSAGAEDTGVGSVA